MTVIEHNAFCNCTGLESIEIPSSVKSIGLGVFANCNSLTGITVAQDNTNFSSAGNCLIETSTKTLIAGCKSSVIPNDGSVTVIGMYAFHNCNELVSIDIPIGVTTIGESAFFECAELTSLTIADTVTSIGTYAFLNCSKLQTVVIPNSVTSIGGGAFNGCKELTSVTLSNSITNISNSMFSGCSKLTSIIIPDNVTSISSHAFNGCEHLTTVTMSKNVTSIGDSAFSVCIDLTTMIYGGTADEWNAISKDPNWMRDTGYFNVECADGNTVREPDDKW